MSTAPKLLCDEMLKGLARWLRAAGYNTLCLEDGDDDSTLLKRAVEEDRILVTRDRPLLEHRAAQDNALLLSCNEMHECAEELTRKLHINWLYRPFTRCMVCNTPLQEASAEQRSQIPEDARQDERVLYCPHCDKLYWEGSHVRRIRRRLQSWNQGDFRPE